VQTLGPGHTVRIRPSLWVQGAIWEGATLGLACINGESGSLSVQVLVGGIELCFRPPGFSPRPSFIVDDAYPISQLFRSPGRTE